MAILIIFLFLSGCFDQLIASPKLEQSGALKPALPMAPKVVDVPAGQKQTISCPQSRPHLWINSAVYKKASFPRLPRRRFSGGCNETNVLALVSRKCLNQKTCLLLSDNNDFLADPQPCQQFRMKLTVNYSCNEHTFAPFIIQGPMCDFLRFSRYCVN